MVLIDIVLPILSGKYQGGQLDCVYGRIDNTTGKVVSGRLYETEHFKWRHLPRHVDPLGILQII